MTGRRDEPFETRDDWQEAWDLAVDYRAAALELGIKRLVTVKPVIVSTGPRRKDTVYGVFFDYTTDGPEAA